MIIDFDPRTMSIRLVVGCDEEYKPNDEIKEVFAKVDKLKKELEEFQEKVIHPQLKEIEESVKKQNAKLQPKLVQKVQEDKTEKK